MKSFLQYPSQILSGLKYYATRKKALVYSFVPFTEKPKPLSYTVAPQDTPVVTVLPDGAETRNTAKMGDLIVTGISGERYVVRAAKISTLYSGAVGKSLVVAPNPRRVARYTGAETITFKAPWGEEMILKSGDYVVQDGTGHYRIAKREFELTYEMIP